MMYLISMNKMETNFILYEKKVQCGNKLNMQQRPLVSKNQSRRLILTTEQFSEEKHFGVRVREF